MNELDQLKSLIHTHATALACETHPHVCALRDHEYPTLETKVVATIQAADPNDVPSVQTVLAEMEAALGEVEGEE